MATDWNSVLKERGDIAKEIIRNVPPMLADPALTLDQATRLYHLLEQRAQEAEELAHALDQAEQSDELIEAAEALEDVFSDLAAAAAEKMIELRRE
jgi:predicted trehalose synthase